MIGHPKRPTYEQELLRYFKKHSTNVKLSQNVEAYKSLYNTMSSSEERSLALDWTQTSPSTYEREIDDFEKFFHFVAATGQGRPDKQNWHVTTAVKVDTHRENFVTDVREAWKALRYDFPSLAAVIENHRWVYRLAGDEAELSSWLEETFHVHYVQCSARQMFPFETNPSTRAVLHVLPNTQEIVLQAPHTHFDGIGMATFFNHLLRLLVGPEEHLDRPFGTEGLNLTPPLTITANVKPYTPSQKQTWDDNLSNFFSQLPTVRVRNENRGARAGATKTQWLTFSREETAAIASRSKELGFSVTAGIQAAMSHAARIHGQVSNTTHSTFAIYSARDYIDPAVHDHSTLVGPHVLSMPGVFPIVPDSFVETARMARQVFLDYKKDDLLRAASPFWATDIPAALSTPPPPEWPVAADLQLSSLGVVDKYVDSVYESSESGARPAVEVRDLWFALEILYPNVAADVWTFRGQLMIELIYNESYHREESVRLLLGLIHEQLSQGLGLNLAFDARSPGDESFMKPRGVEAPTAPHQGYGSGSLEVAVGAM